MEQSGVGVEMDNDLPIAQLIQLIRKQARERKRQKGIKNTVDNGSILDKGVIFEERTAVDNGCMVGDMEQSGEEVDNDDDLPIAQSLELIRKQGRKRKREKVINGSILDENIVLEERTVDDNGSYDPSEMITLEEANTSVFSNSAEDYLTYVNAVSVLCGDMGSSDFDPVEVERFASSISFVRDLFHLNYPSREIRFACENEGTVGKEVIDELVLPALSSAKVQKKRTGKGDALPSAPSQDFVLNVGGSVWALDWCPRVESSSHGNFVKEFIAVSTHPPDSSYHKLGEPLEGRGVIQIWCLLHTIGKDGELHLYKTSKKPEKRGRPRKQPLDESAAKEISKKPERRGRPRKQPLDESVETIKKPIGRPRKKPLDESIETIKKPKGRPRKMPLIKCNIQNSPTLDDDGEPSRHKTSKKKKRGTSKKQKERGTPRVQPLDESAGKEVPGEGTELHSEVTKNKSFSTGAKGRKSSYKAGKKTQVPESEVPTCMADANMECSDPETSRKQPLDESAGKEVPGVGTELDSEVTKNKSFSTGAKVRKSRYKAGEKSQVPSEIPICMADASMELSSPQTSREFIRTAVGEGTSVGLAAECGDRQPPPDSLAGNGSATASHFSDNRLTKESIPKDVSLPRMVLGLSHNGKVAWDVKWRPSAIYDQQRMGYLAVLLGNGALEVWDVPLPRTVQVIYRSCQENGIDPRFLKLEPVFRCSGIKFGSRHSIPLTLEWSTLWPYDMILAGCHDGTVAVWKFCASGSSADTRPLLCFTADSAPIRAISWAPTESVSESSNIIVTAGHKGLKFWDIRDPFRPLWDFPLQRIVYSLHWLPDPRCVITSLDDGSLRILNLVNAANCLPVTGSRFTGTAQQGFISYMCSPSPIWSIHASKLAGVVAYCSADGTALRFEMTQRAMGKDAHRNRAPHFLCGSVIKEEDPFLTIFTPLPDTPFPMRRSLTEWGDTPRSMRGFLAKYGQDKRAKSNNKTDAASGPSNILALCDGGVLGAEAGHDNNNSTVGQEGKTKKKVNNEPVGVDENTEVEKRGTEQKDIMKVDDDDDDIGTLPPKNVAMHKVRWNRNKGSENWLCFGGAAGILRCQAVRL